MNGLLNKSINSIFMLIFLGLFFVLSIPAFCQYTYTNVGPYSSENIGSLQDLPGNYSSHIFLGNLYHSKDGGDTFEQLFNHFSLNGTIGLASKIFEDRFDDDIIYMSIDTENSPAPFARSLDGGKNWEFIKEPFGEEKYSRLICQDATGTLFIITAGHGLSSFSLYKSLDKGSTWKRVEIKRGKKKIESSGIYHFWADPVKPGFLYAVWINGTWNGYEAAFIVSTDGGENWERRENGLEHNTRGYIKNKWVPYCVTQSFMKPYRIYLVNGNGFVEGHNVMAFSDDRGKNWKAFQMDKEKSQFRNVKGKPGTKNVLYATGAGPLNAPETGYTFYKSKDGGKSWKRKAIITNPPEGYCSEVTGAWNLFVTKTGKIIIKDYVNGILISDDEGETFTINNDSIKSPVVQLFKTSKGEIIAGSKWYTFFSKDNSTTWNRSLFGPAFSIRETMDETVLGLRYYFNVLNICKEGNSANCEWLYTDGGDLALEWIENQHRIISGPNSYPVIPGSSPTSYFYKSDDYGNSWEQLGFIPGKDRYEYLSVTSILVSPNNTNLLVAAGYYDSSRPLKYGSLWDASRGAIYLSEDQGYTWREVLGQDKIGSVISLRRDECNPNVLVAGASGLCGKGGVFVSEDFGRTWERRSEGLKDYYGDPCNLLSVVVSPVRDGVLYCAVNLNGGIYKSENLGRTWTKIADNPVQFSEDFINNYVCIGEGVNEDKPITLSTLCMTDILPLDDGKDSLLISTLADGIFLAEKENLN